MPSATSIVDKLFSWLDVSLAADNVQRMNYFVVGLIVSFACGFIALFQDWSGLDISCWLPSDRKMDGMKSYLESVCYYQGLKLQTAVGGGARYDTINVIYHYPYLLSNMICCFGVFMLIHALWLHLLRKLGSIESWNVSVIKSYSKKANANEDDLEDLSIKFVELFGHFGRSLLWTRVGIQALYTIIGLLELVYLNQLITSDVWPSWIITSLVHIVNGKGSSLHFPSAVWCETSYATLASTKSLYLYALLVVNVLHVFNLFAHFFHKVQMRTLTNMVDQKSKMKYLSISINASDFLDLTVSRSSCRLSALPLRTTPGGSRSICTDAVFENLRNNNYYQIDTEEL